MKEKNIEINAIDKLVSRRVKYRRRTLGISQRDMAKHVGLSIQQIYKYEMGINRISCGILHSISILLKVPVSYFFNEDNITDEINENIKDLEVIKLLAVYNKIDDVDTRKKVIDLIKILGK